ncbi:hypothetical protein [Streptomyces sp. NPDC091278]
MAIVVTAGQRGDSPQLEPVLARADRARRTAPPSARPAAGRVST